MNRAISYLIGVFTFLGISYGQNPTVLVTIDNQPIHSEEFVYVFNKNNFDGEFTKKEIDAYLEKYIEFKLKVREAEIQKIDTSEKFQSEYKEYLNQIVEPYLSNRKDIEALVAEAYQRSLREIHVSHLLIMVDEFAAPSDTLRAYQKIVKIRNSIKSFNEFENSVMEFSEEPLASNTKGDLGYFTVFDMVYPFESVAFETPIGEVSKPVRTKFGYHLIWVQDERPASGMVQVSHIMLRFRQGMNAIDSNRLENLALKIKELSEVTPWDSLCLKYSQDFRTNRKGGKLPPFANGQMIPEFEKIAFGLTNPGEISAPFKTNYGWHLVRLDRKIGIGTFEEEKKKLEKKINKDSRGQLPFLKRIERLKKEYHFKESLETPEFLNSLVTMDLSELPRDFSLFSLNEMNIKSGEFLDYLNGNTKSVSTISEKNLLLQYQNLINEKLLENEIIDLEKNSFEFKMLKKEFYEGLLLFQLMEDMVWQKAAKDSIGLNNYYQNTKAIYKTDNNINAILITIYDHSVEEEVETYLNELNYISLSDSAFQLFKKELFQRFDSQSGVTLQVEKGSYDISLNDWAKNITLKPGVHKVWNNGKIYFVLIDSILNGKIPELKNIKGKVIADYQDFLDKQLIEKLKAKYQIELNRKELKNVYKTVIN